MSTWVRSRRSGLFVGVATTALTLAAVLTTPVTAETTHEANVAAAAIAAADATSTGAEPSQILLACDLAPSVREEP